MGSKWSRYPTPRLRPAICASFAGSCLPPFPIALPPILWAYIVWCDLDPLDPIAGSGFARLFQIDGSTTYYGISMEATVQVGAAIAATPTPGFWTITTILYYHDHVPANYNWGDRYVDPTKPFDTGHLEVTNLPGLDFHKVRVTT